MGGDVGRTLSVRSCPPLNKIPLCVELQHLGHNPVSHIHVGVVQPYRDTSHPAALPVTLNMTKNCGAYMAVGVFSKLFLCVRRLAGWDALDNELLRRKVERVDEPVF